MGREGGASPEVEIKKEDLSPRDRLVRMQEKLRVRETQRKNLWEVFSDVTRIKQAIYNLERVLEVPLDDISGVEYNRSRKQHEKELVDKYEKFITDAEKGTPLDQDAVNAWIKQLAGDY